MRRTIRGVSEASEALRIPLDTFEQGMTRGPFTPQQRSDTLKEIEPSRKRGARGG